MKDFIFYQLLSVSKDCNNTRYFDSLELLKHVLYLAIDDLLDVDPNISININTSCPIDKPITFEIHRHDISVLSLSDL